MNVSFNGIGENLVTFETNDNNVTAGTLVKISANGTVSKCATGDTPCGICVEKRNSLCSVLISGYCKVKLATGSNLSLGFGYIVADTDNKVKSAEKGLKVLTVDIDSNNTTAGLFIK